MYESDCFALVFAAGYDPADPVFLSAHCSVQASEAVPEPSLTVTQLGWNDSAVVRYGIEHGPAEQASAVIAASLQALYFLSQGWHLDERQLSPPP